MDRCLREISEIERLLRDGHPDVQGLCLALFDWRTELKLIESTPRGVPLAKRELGRGWLRLSTGVAGSLIQGIAGRSR